MKGLLLKDLHLIWRSFRLYIAMYLVLGLGGVLWDNISLLASGAGMLSTVAISTMSMDERSTWESYCQAMPISRGLYVVEKYLVVLLVALAGVLIVLLCSLAGRLGLEKTVLFTAISGAIMLLVPAFYLPFAFALGSEKGRPLQMLSFLAIIGGVAAAAAVALNGAWSSPLWLLLIPLAYVFSLLLSQKLYRRREL